MLPIDKGRDSSLETLRLLCGSSCYNCGFYIQNVDYEENDGIHLIDRCTYNYLIFNGDEEDCPEGLLCSSWEKK